jgi:hypothetical protein
MCRIMAPDGPTPLSIAQGVGFRPDQYELRRFVLVDRKTITQDIVFP